MSMARPHLRLDDPARRAGLALLLGGAAVSGALLFAQRTDPPLALAGFGEANAASGLLFVMAGGVLLAPPSLHVDAIGRPSLARLFCILGLASLAAPALLRPWFGL